MFKLFNDLWNWRRNALAVRMFEAMQRAEQEANARRWADAKRAVGLPVNASLTQFLIKRDELKRSSQMG